MWKDGKRWVYSVTYDEGVAALMDYAVPVNRKYGVPGHVALVASQIGVPRNHPGSSYDGMMILSKEQIHQLRAEGWGVSCHSMTHCGVKTSNAQDEVVKARKVIEETLGFPVPMFCVPSDNNGYPPSLAVAQQAGYTSIMTIFDDINTMDTDPMRLGRCPLHTEYPPPFYSAYDPYKRLHQARDRQGWVIDYCHCPMPGKPVHPWKDCTLEQLAQRFDAVRRVGGDEVWIADPNEVVDYMLAHKRAAR